MPRSNVVNIAERFPQMRTLISVPNLHVEINDRNGIVSMFRDGVRHELKARDIACLELAFLKR